MKFNPMDEEVNEEKPKRELLPDGEYDFEVVDAEEKISQAGNEMIKLKLKVGDRFIFEHLVHLEKIAWKIKRFCESVDMIDHYRAGCLAAGDIIGRRGRCRICTAQREGYDPQNRVDKWLRGGPQEELKTFEELDKDAADKMVDRLSGEVVYDRCKKEEEDLDDLPF
jgi:hypothetical protein